MNLFSNKKLPNTVAHLTLLLGVIFFSCQEKEQISYNQHIRPILNENCLSCHGGIKQSGDFSLLFEEDVYKTTESGKPPIVPGNRHKSELYNRIVHHDPEYRMPQDAGPLTEAQIELIGEWIDQGAEWETHWAFIAPEMPEFPALESDWVVNPIDAFILEEMRNHGLNPQPEARKEILIRRLSLDLIGLPPTVQEVDRFLNDQSPDAYENLVDRLLSSPHFGERWASLWLDLARYADSNGYEKDHPRNIWRFRDWVINAFNQDMPFDQFTIEQLAGDLLDHPSDEQLIATAFHRNTMTNTEGGTEDEEFRVAAVVDRVNTTFEVWQSLTMACVQCHDHPYDPIRQQEYYQSYAFFNQSQDNDLDMDFPLLQEYTEEEEKEITKLINEIDDLNPVAKIDDAARIQDRIKQAVFPTLLPLQVDDFHNVLLYENDELSNWSKNVNTQKDKQYYFQYSDIDFTGLSEITIDYTTGGKDAEIQIFVDSLGETPILTVDLPFTGGVRGAEGGGKPNRKTDTWTLDHGLSGSHDLIVKLVNTTGEVPDGIVTIRKIRLGYENQLTGSPALEKLQQQLLKYRENATYTPIMKDRSAFHRTTRILERGNYLVPGDTVSAGVPASLPAFNGFPSNRLGLAQWMVDETNPLTGRVLVNRLWEQLFGIGIIETTEDFGTQGASPSHPELLDYLAVQAANTHQWSIKSILKEIVMSATYRQSSKFTPEKLEKDPYNRLLSRGPRFRLSAEQIRDQMLAVSGLLNKTIGGESVMPPQPDDIWNVVYSNHKWETKPEDKYRRGLYTFWRRTTPYPSMVSFDSPSREFCVSRRIRTNTPLQALITLNDPVYLEASHVFAKQMMKNSPDNPEQAIKTGYKMALSQEPDQETLEILNKLYYNANTELKGELVASREQPAVRLDAMTVVANAIMNLDEFVTKE